MGFLNRRSDSTAGPGKSIASILAIIAAIASFVVDNAALKFSSAIAGVVLGIIGMLMAASPRVSGGVLSIMAVGIAVVGLVWAILDALVF